MTINLEATLRIFYLTLYGLDYTLEKPYILMEKQSLNLSKNI